MLRLPRSIRKQLNMAKNLLNGLLGVFLKHQYKVEDRNAFREDIINEIDKTDDTNIKNID